MKKNLLALLAVLLLVAVASRLQKEPERVLLERDLKASLEVLWRTSDHQAEIVDTKGGLVARLSVNMPKDGDPVWNNPFLNFVAARHPKIQLAGLEVTPAPAPLTESPRVELLRRQTQSLVDGTLGAGKGLVLLTAVDSNEPQASRPARVEEGAPANQAVPRPDSPSGGAPFMLSQDRIPPQVPGPQVLEECLVILPEVAEQPMKILQAQIQVEAPCKRFRLVRLPAL